MVSPTPPSCCRAEVRAETSRSGLVESTDRTSAIALDASGHALLHWGEPDRPIFYRSAIKPFQATAAMEAGASLPMESLAVVCASHAGSPVHLAHVRSILETAGLDERALQTPQSWPLDPAAERRLCRAGHDRPRRIFHNCSGKHAGWLAACVAAGHPLDSYLDHDHPIQVASRSIVAHATQVEPERTGIDGCGAPTLRGSLRGLALGFSTLTSVDRYQRAATAMARYGALVGGNTFPHGRIAAWWPGPMKAGAEGLLAAGRNGLGIAVKSEAGSHSVAAMAMMVAMRRLGLLPAAAVDALSEVAEPPVLGGGRTVGRVVARDVE